MICSASRLGCARLQLGSVSTGPPLSVVLSGIAVLDGSIVPGISYGNGWSAVVGASGSLDDLNCVYAATPSVGPSFAIRYLYSAEFATSLPPPRPKMPPISPAMATTSPTFHDSGGSSAAA